MAKNWLDWKIWGWGDLVCEWLVKFAYKRGCKNLEVGFGLQEIVILGWWAKLAYKANLWT
ncbi:hypothetical protein F7P74_05070 [Helicobacter pullorum NCTC 12824]|uniref:hypothetical protein n=1 Tax=Helicobacter pullorum TaxID=35818 RepID=UPI001247287E|nr:hypothetical protein [Helicobacter pullorum]KAB0575023.1 hypothetical protein F7P74_05070 [Helicobacter pullorum NCTC 12824]